jgi:hypothetical protein
MRPAVYGFPRISHARLSEKGTSNSPSEDLAAIRSTKWAEKYLLGRPVRLRWERLRDFSDSLSRILGAYRHQPSLAGIISFVSSAIAGLIGAAIGALAGIAGAFISQRMQARATQERTLQSKREEAYSSTLRYLLRVQNRRSGISAGHIYIAQESFKEFVDDMVEAQFWASTLTIYCSEEQRETVKKVSRDLNETVADFVSGELAHRSIEGITARMKARHSGKEPEEPQAGLFSMFSNWYETILACAREDVGKSYVV